MPTPGSEATQPVTVQGATQAPDTTPVASDSNAAAPAFLFPMGVMALVVQSLQAMFGFAEELAQKFAENTKKLAYSYMGATENPDGSFTIDLKKSILFLMQQATIEQGKQDANKLIASAMGHIGSMLSNVVGLGATAYGGAKDARQAAKLNTEKATIQSTKTRLDEAKGTEQATISSKQAADDAAEAAAATAKAKGYTDDDIKGQINKWKKGDFSNDGKTEVHEAALAKLANKSDESKVDRAEIEQSIKDSLAANRSAMDQIFTKAQSRNMTINQATQLGSAASTAGAEFAQAEHTKASALAQAAASVLQQVNSTATDNIKDYKEKLQQAIREAQEDAKAIASLQVTRG